MNNQDDLTLVSVRGFCDGKGKHGAWSHEVPRISAEQAKGQCPHCTPVLKPVRFELVDLRGDCSTHGAWRNPVLKQLADKMAGRCPECDREALAAKDRDQLQAQRTAVAGKRDSRMRQVLDGAEIPKRFAGRSFENYRLLDEGGAPQADALNRATKFAQNFPKVMERGANFVFCGKPGAGKTHLACAIANHVMRTFGASALFITVFDAIQRVKSTYGDKSQSERAVMQAFTEPDLLILDEVGVQFGTDFEKVIITDLINRRYNDMRPTIILSNLDEAELSAFLGERIMDRMFEGGGGVIGFGWGSYRTSVLGDKDLPRGQYQAPDWLQDE